MKPVAVAFLLAILTAACGGPQARYDRVIAALPNIGSPVPNFAFPDSQGTLYSRESIKGHPAVVALWSSTCQGSRMALEELNKLGREYAAAGLEVLIIADDSDPGRVRAVMDSVGVDLPYIYASGNLIPTFHTSRSAAGRVFQKATGRANFAMPSFLVVDSTGIIQGRSVGVELNEPRLQLLRKHVNQLVASG